MKEVDEEVMEVEQRGGEEVTTFMNVKDPTDPLNVQQSKSFKNLAINSAKDINLSDTAATDHNDNSKAEAMVSSVAKANPGSNMSHQADPLNANHASAAEVYEEDKEKQDTDTESEEEVEDERVKEEEVDEEVKIVDEIKGKSKEEEVEQVAKKGVSRTGALWGAADLRIKEVKAKV